MMFNRTPSESLSPAETRARCLLFHSPATATLANPTTPQTLALSVIKTQPTVATSRGSLNIDVV